MKTYLPTVFLIILILLSIATAVTKLIQMPEEMELFRHAGFSDSMTILFGIIQLVGGILLVPGKTRKYGAIVMLSTFVIATIVVFMKGMIGFGLFSMLFIALAGYQWWLNK
ncbi:MAG: DoxX family protein [Bacteroidota bacterium]